MVGFHLGRGHGPLAPSMGLGIDNLLETEVLQVGSDAHDNPVGHKKIASRHQNLQLFWAMRGGGGSVWGVILSMTIRVHKVLDGGLSRVYNSQKGNFCPASREFGYKSEDNYGSAYDYLLSMRINKFSLNATNPLLASSPPSDGVTVSQNSVSVLRHMMETNFASTIMDVLNICVKPLKTPDRTSPDPVGYCCGFHYLYILMTGNHGSVELKDISISAGFRLALMLWNACTLTTQQADNTIYKLGLNRYLPESLYVMHNCTTRYWGQKTYGQLLAVKKAHDPRNLMWYHHCVRDDPNDAYGEPLGAAADTIKKDGAKVEVKDEL